MTANEGISKSGLTGTNGTHTLEFSQRGTLHSTGSCICHTHLKILTGIGSKFINISELKFSFCFWQRMRQIGVHA